jgi:hypothetical protein
MCTNIQTIGETLASLSPHEALGRVMRLLEEELRGVRPDRSQLLRDIVAADYAAQVLEALRGIRTLLASDATRMAYPLARNAFEAFHELLDLTEVSTDGLGNNARFVSPRGGSRFYRRGIGSPSMRRFLVPFRFFRPSSSRQTNRN